MGVKRMTKQELQDQVNMWQEFAASAVAFAQAVQKIADSYKPDIGEYISGSNAAKLLGVSRALIYKAVSDGDLPRERAGIPVDALMAWAKSSKRRQKTRLKAYRIE